MVQPREGWDLGAGPGRALDAVVRGGAAGLILDTRGHDMAWPAAALERRARIRGWLEAMAALPPGLAT
jgi:hypothetical protein